MNATDCQCTGDKCDRTGRPITAPMRERCKTDRRYQLTLLGVPRQNWPEELQTSKVADRPPAPPPPPLKQACAFLGPVSEPATCMNAGSHVHHCLFDGHHYERCVRGPSCNKEFQSCESCRHHHVPDEFVRHLCYHIYPATGNGRWQWNVDELCKRLPLFNGKRVVAIVIDPPQGRKPDPQGVNGPKGVRCIEGCASADQVISRFGEHANGVEFVVAENDPNLREVLTMPLMFERLPQGPGDVTLYAQAKGTTQPLSARPVHRWAEALYEIYCDYWPAVSEHLARFPVVGAFKKLGAGWRREMTKSDWHWSGSWAWFRNVDLLFRDWRKVDQFWSGVEPYWSQHFTSQEAGCLFHEAAVPEMNLYSRQYWRQTVEGELAKFREAHADKRWR